MPEKIRSEIQHFCARQISEISALNIWVVFNSAGKAVDWWFARGSAIRQAKMIGGLYKLAQIRP